MVSTLGSSAFSFPAEAAGALAAGAGAAAGLTGATL